MVPWLPTANAKCLGQRSRALQDWQDWIPFQTRCHWVAGGTVTAGTGAKSAGARDPTAPTTPQPGVCMLSPKWPGPVLGEQRALCWSLQPWRSPPPGRTGRQVSCALAAPRGPCMAPRRPLCMAILKVKQLSLGVSRDEPLAMPWRRPLHSRAPDLVQELRIAGRRGLSWSQPPWSGPESPPPLSSHSHRSLMGWEGSEDQSVPCPGSRPSRSAPQDKLTRSRGFLLKSFCLQPLSLSPSPSVSPTHARPGSPATLLTYPATAPFRTPHRHPSLRGFFRPQSWDRCPKFPPLHVNPAGLALPASLDRTPLGSKTTGCPVPGAW
uniref:uncharacterized protein LOC120884003 n=1 Tax=Ictidomys tridecemlineatus TaxID=43179 RepID=UPI001A9EED3C|nr:uncharacterized protein LOC120884003 [Ictidomys tridecemlineatus]